MRQLVLDSYPGIIKDSRFYEFAPKVNKEEKVKIIHEYDVCPKPGQSQLILIPTISVHPHSISFYKQIVWSPEKPQKTNYDGESIQEFRTHKHLLQSSRTAQGQVSSVAKRKITKAIDYLLLFANDKQVTSVSSGRKFRFKIAFITLTLPSAQIHDDNEIKRKCLNSFLIEIQKFYKVRNFVWRAEKQKNGNLHFHIIIDKFIHWNEIRNRWNRIINKLGYVDNYRKSMKEFYKDGFVLRNDLIKTWSETKQRAAYKANLETGYHNPNSTDIHSIQKIHNLQHYFVKYMAKNEKPKILPSQNPADYITQKGRIWGSSKNLQNIKGAQLVVDWQLEKELEAIIADTSCKVYDSDYFSVFYIDFPKLRLAGDSRIFNAFTRYLVDEFGFNYQLST